MYRLRYLCSLFLVLLFSDGIIADPKSSFTTERPLPKLEGKMINDQRDIADAFDELRANHDSAPDFRFLHKRGNVYTFVQWINGIQSTNRIYVHVDGTDQTVTRVKGNVVSRPMPEPKHKFNGQNAINMTLKHIRKGGERPFGESHPVVRDGNHQAFLIYRGDEVWHGVGIEIDHPRMNEAPEVFGVEWYWIDPEGTVTPWLEGGEVHTSIEVCDGSSTSIAFCSDASTPTVINHAGQCQAGYNCSGTNNEYQAPYDTTEEVEDMWEDLRDSTNCCDVGENNQHYGGDIEINVDGDTGTAAAKYIAHRMGPNQIRRAVMVIDSDFAGNQIAEITAHELGHAYHAKESWGTFSLNAGSGGTLAQRREHRAVLEAIADINSVIFQNYTGSGFAVPPDYDPVSTAGDYSDQFDYSDISAGRDDYQNGQVGGHAFYELAQAVGLELASKIFLLGVNHMADDNSNGKVSFLEMRQGQLDAANALNLSTAEINAVKDAWNDVDVGAAGTGPQIQPPTTTPPSGSPSSPGSVSISLTNNCLWPWTGYSLSWSNVAGATYYDVFHKFGAGAWQLTGSTTNNPESFWTTGDATVTVRACNSSGCSALSNDTESATNNC